jgi:hypothetical protein
MIGPINSPNVIKIVTKLLSVFYLIVGVPSFAADFTIATQQHQKNADMTTHEIHSGEVILGISEFGGGYINKLFIPGIGDIIGKHAARYGRGGQTSIRDELHGRRYNPTQAGFSDTAGTHCVIEQPSKGYLYIPPRPVALFNGDGKYDFTEWENLAKDPYDNDGGNSDQDNIDESTLGKKQEDEITSEFDFTGSYEDIRDGEKITIPAFKFGYEFRFIRKPGHCLKQFGTKTPIYDLKAEISDRSNLTPPGKHSSTEDSLTDVILSSTLRGDKAIWDPAFAFFVDKTGTQITTKPLNSTRQVFIENSQLISYPLIIFSESKNPNQGPAIGYFHPHNHTNQFSVVGRSIKNNNIVYEDVRTTSGNMLGNDSRTPEMWLIGIRTNHSGLLNRNETPNETYEALRGEDYILIGTPNEILEATKVITR